MKKTKHKNECHTEISKVVITLAIWLIVIIIIATISRAIMK